MTCGAGQVGGNMYGILMVLAHEQSDVLRVRDGTRGESERSAARETRVVGP